MKKLLIPALTLILTLTVAPARAQSSEDAKNAVVSILQDWFSRFGSRTLYPSSVVISNSNEAANGEIVVTGTYKYRSNNCGEVESAFGVYLSKAPIGYRARRIISSIPFCTFGVRTSIRWYAYEAGQEKGYNSAEEAKNDDKH